MRWFKSEDGLIEFRCLPEDWDVIPKPYPARKYVPEWYKALGNRVRGDDGKEESGFRTSTVKRCPPFLDAMQAGYIIPLAADVHMRVNEDCSSCEYRWDFYRTMIENHSMRQVEGIPGMRMEPMKWMNYWSIRVPDGWSVLFVDPINRPNGLFTCFAGIVDCDKYEEFINFPFHWTRGPFDGVVPAGTPLVQVIPIRRDVLELGYDCRPLTEGEQEEIRRTRARRSSHESLYRDKMWVRK